MKVAFTVRTAVEEIDPVQASLLAVLGLAVVLLAVVAAAKFATFHQHLISSENTIGHTKQATTNRAYGIVRARSRKSASIAETNDHLIVALESESSSRTFTGSSSSFSSLSSFTNSDTYSSTSASSFSTSGVELDSVTTASSSTAAEINELLRRAPVFNMSEHALPGLSRPLRRPRVSPGGDIVHTAPANELASSESATECQRPQASKQTSSVSAATLSLPAQPAVTAAAAHPPAPPPALRQPVICAAPDPDVDLQPLYL